MNRLTTMGISALVVAATAAGALVATSAGATMASPAAARVAVSRQATTASCRASRHSYAYPAGARTFKAWSAGSVTVAPVNRGTIKVAGVKAAPGWRGRVDSRSGSSVDVYFRSGAHLVKFEAEINDSHGLTVTLSNCDR
jgi:hypothetical protein